MKKWLLALMLLGALGVGLPGHAAEPSLHEVYQAAEAGRLDEAQRMMKEVLLAHPRSGKAHYVEAELLAKEGHVKEAAIELATAEDLAPGLPFASAQAVASLKEAVGAQAAARGAQPSAPANLPPHSAAGFPWGLLAAGLGLAALVVFVIRAVARRNARPRYEPPSGGYGYPASGGGAAPYPSYPGAGPAAGSPGLGSQVLGGLATGAAVGAGMVAGEALMHRMMDGHKEAASGSQGLASLDDIPSLSDALEKKPGIQDDNADMGGTDFGVSDASSWDDGGGSGDSDWS